MTKHGCPATKIPIAGAPGLSAPAALGYNKCPHECVRNLESLNGSQARPMHLFLHLHT